MVHSSILTALVLGFEVAGLAVLLSSGILAIAKWFRRGVLEFWRGEKPATTELRLDFGHRIVFALEFFISADIIASIQTPTFAELGKLAVVVVIRTILHYSLR